MSQPQDQSQTIEDQKNQNQLTFYDVVIDIESLLDLTKGYPIEYTEKGFENIN